jgi:SAM-dependent methyltransferase
MRPLLIAVSLVVITALCGAMFMDRPYRLQAVYQAGDQAALDHRDSAYSSITWIASPAENYLQLRFFDRVEGGVCLRPSWGDLVSLAATQPTLAHLVPTGVRPARPAGTMWPHPWTPDPGTLSNSAYVRLFPVGVLMNEKLVAAAKGEVRAVAPRIMVVGLGSGIGIATLAHHFPEAAITVVDIDQVVIDMVRDHYPLLDWLTQQKRQDGTPRLRFIARDARQYIRYDATREAKYDLVVLDAYTSGSTIPPHLMTREFFAQCGDILSDHGLVLANIIGNVSSGADARGDKSLVLGGAIRSFRAAGLAKVWCFPILNAGDSAGFIDAARQRNNIVVAGRTDLSPRAAAAGWERLRGFTLLPELPVGTYTTASYLLVDARRQVFTSASLSAELLDRIAPGLRAKLETIKHRADGVQQPTVAISEDRGVVEQAIRAVQEWSVKERQIPPLGWSDIGDSNCIQRRDTDWVLASRETLRVSLATARDVTKWSGEALTGDIEQGERPPVANATWLIPDAPLFTDQRPNADIYNH